MNTRHSTRPRRRLSHSQSESHCTVSSLSLLFLVTRRLTPSPFGSTASPLDGLVTGTAPRARCKVRCAASRGASRWLGGAALGAAVAPAAPFSTIALGGEACVVVVPLGSAAPICVTGLGLITRVRDRAPCQHLVPVHTQCITVTRAHAEGRVAGTEGWQGRRLGSI